MYDTGSGVDPVNNLLSAMNVPKLSNALFKRHERVVGPAFNAVARASCQKAIELEKDLTL